MAQLPNEGGGLRVPNSTASVSGRVENRSCTGRCLCPTRSAANLLMLVPKRMCYVRLGRGSVHDGRKARMNLTLRDCIASTHTIGLCGHGYATQSSFQD